MTDIVTAHAYSGPRSKQPSPRASLSIVHAQTLLCQLRSQYSIPTQSASVAQVWFVTHCGL